MTGLAAKGVPSRVGETELRPVGADDADFERAADVAIEAYEAYYPQPFVRDAEIKQWRESVELLGPTVQLIAAYRGGTLVGSMSLYDFDMRLRGAEVAAGGLGGVAVSLQHKRRGVARDMILGYLSFYRERAAPLAALYPFRPDFYRNFGFGYGTPVQRYNIALAALRHDGDRSRVRALAEDDSAATLDSYNRLQATTNGLFRRNAGLQRRMLADKAVRWFGYFEDGLVRGYIGLTIVRGPSETSNRNDLLVRQLVFETPAALAGLLSFTHSLADQYARLVVSTQLRDFYLLASDPRDGTDRNISPPVAHATATQGLGIMYRVLDVTHLMETLAGTRFGALTGTVAFHVRDNIMPGNDRVHVFGFEGGEATTSDVKPVEKPDVTVSLGIADFSSLMTGAISLHSLVTLGCATIDDPGWLERLDRAFATEPPQCMTRF